MLFSFSVTLYFEQGVYPTIEREKKLLAGIYSPVRPKITQASPTVIAQAPPAVIAHAPPAVIAQPPPAVIAQPPPAVIAQPPPAVITQPPSTVSSLPDPVPIIRQNQTKFILTPVVSLNSGGLILQQTQPLLQQGLLPNTVCQVKYVLNTPQMSSTAARGPVGIPQIITPNAMVSSTAVAAPQGLGNPTPASVPQIPLAVGNSVPVANVQANTQNIVQPSTQSHVQAQPVQLQAAETPQVVRSLEFPDKDQQATAQQGEVTVTALSSATASGVAEALQTAVQSSNQAEASVSEGQDPEPVATTSTATIASKPKSGTVRELIARKRKNARNRGFVSMSVLAGKGMSSLSRFKIMTEGGERMKTVGSEQDAEAEGRSESPTVVPDCSTQSAPKSNPESTASGRSPTNETVLDANTGASKTEEDDEEDDQDCIPLEDALKQLEEDEENAKASPSSPTLPTLPETPAKIASLVCTESPSALPASPDVASNQVNSLPERLAASPLPESSASQNAFSGKSPEEQRIEATVVIKDEDSPVEEETASLPTSNSGSPILQSLPAIHKEDSTSQMSEGAASVASDPSLPFDPSLRSDQQNDPTENMVCTATGGKSPTLDEQPSAREFLSGGEQGGPGEEGEEEVEVGGNVKVAAKRIKSKLRKDLESTIVLLDPEIVNQDPQVRRLQ